MKGANLSRSPLYWDEYQHGQQWFRFQPIHKDPRSFQKITIQVREYLGFGWEVHWQYFSPLVKYLGGGFNIPCLSLEQMFIKYFWKHYPPIMWNTWHSLKGVSHVTNISRVSESETLCSFSKEKLVPTVFSLKCLIVSSVFFSLNFYSNWF